MRPRGNMRLQPGKRWGTLFAPMPDQDTHNDVPPPLPPSNGPADPAPPAANPGASAPDDSGVTPANGEAAPPKDDAAPKADGGDDPPPDNNGDPPSAPRGGGPRVFLAWLLLLGMVFLLVSFWNAGNTAKYEEIAYAPDFLELVASHRIKSVEIVHSSMGGTVVQGERLPLPGDDEKGGSAPGVAPRRFKANVLPTDRFQELLEANGIPFRYRQESPLLTGFLYNLLPSLLFLGLLYWFFYRQMRGGPGNFGKSRARLVQTKGKTTFADVAGEDEAKEEVSEIVAFLKDPSKFTKLGGRIPRGVLLVGPPGTGKTLLARAIAGEAGVPFFSISGSDFIEMFVGVGASRVRDMFEQARKNSPCIIFIDEIDAVGRSRFSGLGGGHDEREQTLNQLLTEMDGFEPSSGVIVMAATNRPDVLDPALLRPGRFDRQVVVDLPPLDGRVAILKVHAKKIKLAESVDLERVARGTAGFSGADLANLLNEAALVAARHEKEAVDEADLDEARDKILWGRERKSRVVDEADKRKTAYHEAGHAVVAILSPEADPVHRVTIIPRGMALGATMFLPEKDQIDITRTKALSRLAVSMGGRAAEEVFLPDFGAGAAQDIKQATELAHAMVCKWGMSDRLGPRSFGTNEEHLFLGREVSRSRDFSEMTAQAIDEEVSRLVREAHDRARAILESKREAMEAIVALLLEKETVDGRDIERIVKG